MSKATTHTLITGCVICAMYSLNSFGCAQSADAAFLPLAPLDWAGQLLSGTGEAMQALSRPQSWKIQSNASPSFVAADNLPTPYMSWLIENNYILIDRDWLDKDAEYPSKASPIIDPIRPQILDAERISSSKLNWAINPNQEEIAIALPLGVVSLGVGNSAKDTPYLGRLYAICTAINHHKLGYSSEYEWESSIKWTRPENHNEVVVLTCEQFFSAEYPNHLILLAAYHGIGLHLTSNEALLSMIQNRLNQLGSGEH